jgi:predicted permease
MTSTALATTILTFTAIVGVGAVLRWSGVLRREDAHAINAVVIYAGLPAFVFKAVHGAALTADIWRVIGVAWVVFAATALLAWLLARVLKLPRPTAGGFIIAAALGNTGYIGYPITEAILGANALPEAVFYDVFATVGAFVTVGLLVAQRYGDRDETPVNPLRELLTFPAVVALAAALLLRSVPIPDLVNNGLALLASMVAPLIMLSVGISLRVGTLARWPGPFAILTGVRLLVAPALALALGMLVVGPGLPLRVVVLQAGMPSMMLTYVAGERFGLDTDFIASAIFVTTALSAISLPLVQVMAFR